MPLTGNLYTAADAQPIVAALAEAAVRRWKHLREDIEQAAQLGLLAATAAGAADATLIARSVKREIRRCVSECTERHPREAGRPEDAAAQPEEPPVSQRRRLKAMDEAATLTRPELRALQLYYRDGAKPSTAAALAGITPRQLWSLARKYRFVLGRQ